MQRARTLSLSQGSSEEVPKKKRSVAEDANFPSNLPEYILSATKNFKEGREYSMGGNFQCAKNKFFSGINNLMNEEATSPTSDHEIPVGMSAKDIIAFVDQTCKESFQEVRDFCTRPNSPTNDASLICCRPSRSHIDKMQTESGKLILEGIDYSDPESHAQVKGIVCAVLSDIISALSVCEELLGNYEAHAALTAAESRLQKMLYGEKVMRTVISLCSIDHCMDGMLPTVSCHQQPQSDCDHGLGVDLGIGDGLTPPPSQSSKVPTAAYCLPDSCLSRTACEAPDCRTSAARTDMNMFNFPSRSDDDEFCSDDDEMAIGFFADFE